MAVFATSILLSIKKPGLFQQPGFSSPLSKLLGLKPRSFRKAYGKVFLCQYKTFK
jgi:hypothetical protein